MSGYRRGSHTIYEIKYHLVWVTKYRYQVLKGEVTHRARELIRHIFGSAPPTLSPSDLMKRIKGRS